MDFYCKQDVSIHNLLSYCKTVCSRESTIQNILFAFEVHAVSCADEVITSPTSHSSGISTIQEHTYVYTPGGPHAWGGYSIAMCTYRPSLVSLSHVFVYICTVLSLKVDWDTWDIY